MEWAVPFPTLQPGMSDRMTGVSATSLPAAFGCGRYRFVLRSATTLHFNVFAGATLRGGFGHVFKRTVCMWPPGDCGRCLLKSICAYPYVFETAPPPDSVKLRSLAQVPRPFVIEPPEHGGRQSYRAGECFDFALVLVGRALDYLPYFVLTFRELGQVGLGKASARFDVHEVLSERPAGSQRVYAAAEGVLHNEGERMTFATLAQPPSLASSSRLPRKLVLHFLTPTRIRAEGRLRAELTFQDVVRALLRRLSSLCYFHCGCELPVNFRSLIEQASMIRTIGSELCWHEQDRFSTRQRQRIEMGGVRGRVVFEAPEAELWAPYLPLLAAGEWVHVGKGTVMGLGKYRVELCPEKA
jgi:hypothetical protein